MKTHGLNLRVKIIQCSPAFAYTESGYKISINLCWKNLPDTICQDQSFHVVWSKKQIWLMHSIPKHYTSARTWDVSPNSSSLQLLESSRISWESSYLNASIILANSYCFTFPGYSFQIRRFLEGLIPSKSCTPHEWNHVHFHCTEMKSKIPICFHTRLSSM